MTMISDKSKIHIIYNKQYTKQETKKKTNKHLNIQTLSNKVIYLLSINKYIVIESDVLTT